MGFDTTGDGRPNWAVSGIDMNRDGIPDALQSPRLVKPPAPSLMSSALVPAAPRMVLPPMAGPPMAGPPMVGSPMVATPRAMVPTATMGLDTNGDGRANYAVIGVDMNRDGIPDALQSPRITPRVLVPGVASLSVPIGPTVVRPAPPLATVAAPFASVGVDANGDGRLNYAVTGVDMNRDGIPDALQSPRVPVT